MALFIFNFKNNKKIVKKINIFVDNKCYLSIILGVDR